MKATEILNNHPFHIVDVSPWPFTGASGGLFILAGLTSVIHKYDTLMVFLGLLVVLLTICQWWRDVSREATFQGKHTLKVENGLRLGILLFIISEVCLFFAFFWSFFHSSLRPTVEVGATWPPVWVESINPFGVPLLNTTVLLSRGATITWAHIALLRGKKGEASISLSLTVALGGFFTILQAAEYVYRPFTISDSVYGSTFFLATGFHGLHVLIGSLFIGVILFRHLMGHFSEVHHFGFEGRAWYWHFVDVVWLFLFICVYWWGC